MVMWRFAIYSLLILLPINAIAITADELRSLSSDGARDRQESDSRAKTGNIAPLVPDEQTVSKPKKNGKISTKHFVKERKDVSTTEETNEVPSSPKRGNENMTPHPATPSSGQTIMSDAVPSDSRPFGIRLGTWIEGSIKRNISSAEPGLVEITLNSDVIGDKRTLKAGTFLFAQKQLNDATKRLELMAVKGIDPRGHEFKITGLIFDTGKVSGLPGIINSDTDKTIKRGASKGMLAAVGAAAKTVGNGSPIGSAAGATADSVLQDQSNVVEQTTEQKLTIYVSPQPLLIRVEESF
jgi:hypothetical protein